MSKEQRAQDAERRARCTAAGSAKLTAILNGHEDLSLLRAAILRGDCPLCGETGFKSISGHMYRMHELRSREMRDIFGFTFTESVCAPELHARLSEIHAGKNPSALGKSSGRTLSVVAKQRLVEHGKTSLNSNATREIKAAAGRKGGAKNKGRVAHNRNDAHGAVGMYKRGCRCDLCSDANSAKWKAINARRRTRLAASVQAIT
jgi:hypothetical protein